MVNNVVVRYKRWSDSKAAARDFPVLKAISSAPPSIRFAITAAVVVVVDLSSMLSWFLVDCWWGSSMPSRGRPA
jgi:hypothetical protein